MKKVPSFFTFFRAEADNNNMIIPMAFTQRMEKPFLDEMFLRDRHNHIWKVKMAKVGDYWYFVDGWEKFVSDNLVASRDLLVFTHISMNVFNVKLYGVCATEKNLIAPSFENEEIDDDDDDDDGGEEEEDVDDDDDEEEEEEDDDDEGYQNEYGDENDDKKSKDDGNKNYDEIIEIGNFDHTSVDSDNDDEGDHVALSRRVNSDGVVDDNKQAYPPCYGMEIFEAGLAERPKNPYFVAKVMPKRRGNLFIPKVVINDHGLIIGHEVILVDPIGREFVCKCKKWSNGRFSLAKGWASLCRVNSITEKDKCICEFVQKRGDERQFIQISVVRSNV